jgi:hypothetical protein
LRSNELTETFNEKRSTKNVIDLSDALSGLMGKFGSEIGVTEIGRNRKSGSDTEIEVRHRFFEPAPPARLADQHRQRASGADRSSEVTKTPKVSLTHRGGS